MSPTLQVSSFVSAAEAAAASASLHTCDAQISKVEANFVPLLLPLPLVNNKRGLDYIKQQQQQPQEFDVRAAFLIVYLEPFLHLVVVVVVVGTSSQASTPTSSHFDQKLVVFAAVPTEQSI